MKRANPPKEILNTLTDFLLEIHSWSFRDELRKLHPARQLWDTAQRRNFRKKSKISLFQNLFLVDPGESKSTGSASKVIRNVPKWFESAPNHPQINHEQILKKWFFHFFLHFFMIFLDFWGFEPNFRTFSTDHTPLMWPLSKWTRRFIDGRCLSSQTIMKSTF